MIIVVEGTKNFSDYDTFVRAMGVALSSCVSEKEVEIWSIGPHTINNFTAAFCNITENFLKQKGIKISFKKLPSSFIEDKLSDVSYFAFFGNRKEQISKIFGLAELSGVECEIFRP